MRISDWSSDVCSSDLKGDPVLARRAGRAELGVAPGQRVGRAVGAAGHGPARIAFAVAPLRQHAAVVDEDPVGGPAALAAVELADQLHRRRSEEHTTELQSLMRISYDVLCLKNNNTHHQRRSLQ